MLIHRAFRYKLKTTTIQETLFYQFAGATRWVWNVMLAEQKCRYAEGEKRLGKYDLMRYRLARTRLAKSVHRDGECFCR